MKSIALYLLLSFLIMNISVYAQASQYDFHGFAGSLDLTEIGITFNYTDGTCDGQMASTNTFTTGAGTFDSTITWRMPDSTDIGFSTLTGLSNTSCLSYGRTSLKDIVEDATSGYFESSWSVSHSASSGFLTTESRYLCEVPTDTINFFISNGTDSRGNCLYGIRTSTINERIVFLDELTTIYDRCGDLTDWSASGDCILSFGATCTDCQKTSQYIYPFNSSATGDVDYNITENVASTFMEGAAQTVFVTFSVDLINTESETRTNLFTQNRNMVGNTSFNFVDSGTLSLVSDTEYLMVITFNTTKSGGVDYAFNTFGPTINLSIFTFRPDYVCGEFGPCVNGSQSQVCVDSFGVAPDEIRPRSCFDVPFFENNLGFEEFVAGSVYTCQQTWFLFTCNNFLNVTTTRFPVNWTVSGDVDFNGVTRQNYLTVSSDTATLGSRSIKMWYIPPKPEEPVSDPANSSLTICGNKTIGDFPETTTGFNETLFLSTNITFPAPFIDLRFDVRRCNEPVTQYDYTGDLLGLNCGTRCYAFDCNQTPNGRYGLRLSDSDTSQIIVDYTGFATPDWRSFIIDISNSGLQINHNYTLSLAVNPENQFDAFTHCLYFDNVRATLREGALAECTTVCDGLDQLLAQQQGNSCVFTTITNSPTCAPDSDTSTAFENFEDVCIDSTLHFFNNETGLWDTIEDNDLCLTQINDTEQAIETTEPIGDIVELGETFSFLFSPLFLYLVGAIVLTVICTAVSKHWQIGAIAMSALMFVGSIPSIGLIPIWVTISIIAVTIVLISSKVTGKAFNIGGG